MISASYPPFRMFLGNDNWLRLSSDAYENSPAATAVFDLTFNQVPADDDQLKVSYEGNDAEATIVFKSAPTESMWRFQDGNSKTIQNWIDDHFLVDFNANLLLSSLWKAERQTPNTVRFTALKPGEDYNLSFTATGVFTITANQVTQGVDGVYIENLTIYLELKFRPLGETNWQTRTYYAPTYQGDARFNLSKMLSMEDAQPVLPAYGFTEQFTSKKNIVQYQVRFAELFGNTQAAGNKLLGGATFTAFAGGLSLADYPHLDLETPIDNDEGWLTLMSERVDYYKGQQFFITFLSSSDVALFNWVVTIEYHDGTSEQKSLIDDEQIIKDEPLTLPLHWNMILAEADPAKQIKRFTPAIEIPQSQTLYPALVCDLRPQEHEELTQLLYLNAFGMYEVFAFTGTRADQAEISGQEARIELGPDYLNTDFSGRRYGQSRRLIRSVQTGFKSQAEINRLQELLMSREVRLINGSYYQPVLIEATDLPLYETGRGRQNSTVITIKDPRSETNWSNGKYTV